MPFVRKKKGQVLIVHSRRGGEGRVRQEIIHRFQSQEELRFVSDDDLWERFTASMEWRHPKIGWDWNRIRESLEAEHSAWAGEPSGSVYRRNSKVSMMIEELGVALARVTLAKPSDSSLVRKNRHELSVLKYHIDRLLGPEQGEPIMPIKPREEIMGAVTEDQKSEAEILFDRGMDRWWKGDVGAACRYYRRALKQDPTHADSNNHLGIRALEAGRLKDAEKFFMAAVEGGERDVIKDGYRVPWSIVENRPYLRGLGNLALVFRRRRRYQEAIAIHKKMFELNPNDNQGVRYLLGEEYHRLDDLDAAVIAYRNARDEPSCCFGLALALIQFEADETEIGRAFLHGFALNRYVAPMLLGEPWQRLDSWHPTNMAEPEWAAEYVKEAGDLWRKIKPSADALRWWWNGEPVKEWLSRIDEFSSRLKVLPVSDERSDVVEKISYLESDDHIGKVVDGMCSLS